MKKISLILILSILCAILAACERKCQCVEVPTPDQTENNFASDNESNIPENNLDGPNHDLYEEDASKKAQYINYYIYDRWDYALSDGNGACIVWNYDDLMDFYKKTGYAVLDRYEKEYFVDKALVFATVAAGSGSAMLNVKHLRMVENVLEITVTYRIGECGTDDMQYATYIIEVDKAALSSTTGEDIETQPKVVIEYAYCSQLCQKDDISKEEDFEYYNFNGYIQPIEKSNMFYNHGWLEIISDEYELGRFLDRYTPTDDLSENLISFADKIKTDLHFENFDFFAEKALIVIPYYHSDDTDEFFSYYALKNIVVFDGAVELYFLGEAEYGTCENGIQLAVVDKDILEFNNFIAYFSYLE